MPNVMAAAWILEAPSVVEQKPCNNAANIGECKTWTKVNFAPGKIPLGDKSPENVVYQPRKRPNIVQSLLDLRWATSVQ